MLSREGTTGLSCGGPTRGRQSDRSASLQTGTSTQESRLRPMPLYLLFLPIATARFIYGDSSAIALAKGKSRDGRLLPKRQGCPGRRLRGRQVWARDSVDGEQVC